MEVLCLVANQIWQEYLLSSSHLRDELSLVQSFIYKYCFWSIMNDYNMNDEVVETEDVERVYTESGKTCNMYIWLKPAPPLPVHY